MLTKQKQSGFALLLFMVVLIGMGGVVAEGYMQKIAKEVKQNSFEKNKKILEEAKQALLLYAYSYPDFNSEGPGRLPCPDEDNDGLGDANGPSCIAVGRFPWRHSNLDFYEAKDTSGETLWYAVSNNFHNLGGGPTAVNSDSVGTISIVDQNGNLIYDGATQGVAAVIIAPGAPLARDQDNNGANGFEYIQLRSTVGQKNDPSNYLDDTLTGFDNSIFQNSGNTPANSFIFGPVFDSTQNSIVINDQMVVITTEEVIAVAEKATLQAYRDAINEYQQNIWGATVTNYRYPWLDDYSTTSLTQYDADINTTVGRVPSIFANYFDNTIPFPSQTNASNIKIRVNLSVIGQTVNTEEIISTNASVSFATSGDLLITPSANGVPVVRYYWDELAAPDGWQPCAPITSNTPQDCNQALAIPGVPDSSIVPNQLATRVLEVTYSNNFFNATPFSRLYTINAGSNPVYQAPTAVETAFVYFEYNEALADEIDVSYVYDNNYDLIFNNVLNGNITNYSIGVNYHPVLPRWALSGSNDWHDSIQMSFSPGYQPGGAGNCTIGTDCLTVLNSSAVTNNKAALFVLAGEHGINDNGIAGYTDDLSDLFFGENILDGNGPYTNTIDEDGDSVNDEGVDNIFAEVDNDTVFVLREQ